MNLKHTLAGLMLLATLFSCSKDNETNFNADKQGQVKLKLIILWVVKH